MALIADKTFQLKDGRTLRLRNPKASDAAEVLNCLKIILGETHFTLTEPDEFNKTVEEEIKLFEELNTSPVDLVLLAEVNGKVVSFLDFQTKSKRRRIAHTGYFGISVLKEYWGNGIATKLLYTLIEHGRANDKIELILLAMHSTNERARALYERAGFAECGRIPNEIKLADGTYIDSIIMGLDVRK